MEATGAQETGAVRSVGEVRETTLGLEDLDVFFPFSQDRTPGEFVLLLPNRFLVVELAGWDHLATVDDDVLGAVPKGTDATDALECIEMAPAERHRRLDGGPAIVEQSANVAVAPRAGVSTRSRTRPALERGCA